MSRKHFGIREYGFVLDDETIRYMVSKLNHDYKKESNKDHIRELHSYGLIDIIDNFVGVAERIEDDGSCGGAYKYYDFTSLYYVPLSKYPTLFEKSYSNISECIEEFKSEYKTCLPEDFDYRNSIACIDGTTYCFDKYREYHICTCSCCGRHLGEMANVDSDNTVDIYRDIDNWKFCPFCGERLFDDCER